MRSKTSFNKCNDLDLNEIKSNQWQDKDTDSNCVCVCVTDSLTHKQVIKHRSNDYIATKSTHEKKNPQGKKPTKNQQHKRYK